MAVSIGLCQEIRRLEGFGKYANSDWQKVLRRHAGRYANLLPDRPELGLSSPAITAAQLESVLAPFLDTDLLYARETEYRLTQSILGPIADALDVANLRPEDVAFVLPVGGSSLIPQVVQALGRFFPAAEMLTTKDQRQAQTAVARGAAYQALSLAATGRGVFETVASESVSMRTATGSVTLVERGSTLPLRGEVPSLRVPRSEGRFDATIRIELMAGEGARQRKLYAGTWAIPQLATGGDAQRRRSRTVGSSLGASYCPQRCPESPFGVRSQHPLSHVVSPNEHRLEIDGLEEGLSSGAITADGVGEAYARLAELHVNLRMNEKAVDRLTRAVRTQQSPDGGFLMRVAGTYGDLGYYQREEKFYREAGAISRSGAPWFNLSLSLRRQERYPEALESVDRAIAAEPRRMPYQVCRAMVQQQLGREHRKELAAAVEGFSAVERLDDWTLGWFRVAAELTKDTALMRRIDDERRNRKQPEVIEADGLLPEVVGMVRKP